MEIYRVTKDSPVWQKKGYDYVRIDAFCFGQNIPVEKEFGHDAPEEELNAILIVENHKPIAGLRLEFPKPGIGKIGRVCVVREKQKSGVGSVMIKAAEEWLAELGISHIVISSQDRALGFYQKNGYVLNEEVTPDVYENHPRPRKEFNQDPSFKRDFVCVLVEKYLNA